MAILSSDGQMDDSNSVILFRLPKDLPLDASRTTKTNFTSLGYDVLLMVSDHLDLVDRTCLGLTCKALALILTSAPCFVRDSKEHRVLGLDDVHPGDTRPTVISIKPDYYTLLPRLGKGWIPRDRFKYCWKCNKIYPRDRHFYEKKLTKHKPLGWLRKVELPEHEWWYMSLGAKYEHIIKRWLIDDDLLHESLRYPTRINKVHYSDLGVLDPRIRDKRGPECPMCLERELTFPWRRAENIAPISTAARTALMALVRVPVQMGVAAGSAVAGALRNL